MALVLGTKAGEHDGCFALVRDGVPLFIYEEERFNRIKHGLSCAAHGLREGLADFGVSIDDIDYVTNYVQPELSAKREDLYREFYAEGDPTTGQRRFAQVSWELPLYRQLLIGNGIPAEKIVDVRHHIAHCAGVFYPSPFAEAAILSVDGGGEADTIMLAHGHDEQIDILESNWHPHSLGHFYLAATRWLGWDYGEEGKTMALASYGEPEYYDLLCSEFVEVADDGLPRYRKPMGAEEALFALLGPGRSGGEYSQRHKNVAASVQRLTNEIMLRLARTLKRRTGARHLLITGGVGLNSVANGEIMKAGIFDEVMAYPQANDTGTALGGALWLEHSKLGRRRQWVMRHAYLGREIDLDGVEAAAQRYGLSWHKCPDAPAEAAKQLAAGKIVGWIQDRAEVGPRALGNRSILGDPRRPEIKDEINIKVKHRETWRPFAPSVLAEDCATYFDTTQPLPYMIVVADVRAEWRDKLDAICHVDGTARVQTVEAEQNPRFHALISSFKALTGIGMVLNTSFNDRGEPLVQTAEQAIEDFLRTDMDVLFVGDYMFEHKPAGVRPEEFHAARENVRQLDAAERILLLSAHSLDEHAALLRALGEQGKSATLVVFNDATREHLEQSNWFAQFPALRQTLSHTALDETLLAAHQAVVFLTPWVGCNFVFDRDVLEGSLMDMTRTLSRSTALPVFWADRFGGIADMTAPIHIRDWCDAGQHPRAEAHWMRGAGR